MRIKNHGRDVTKVGGFREERRAKNNSEIDGGHSIGIRMKNDGLKKVDDKTKSEKMSERERRNDFGQCKEARRRRKVQNVDNRRIAGKSEKGIRKFSKVLFEDAPCNADTILNGGEINALVALIDGSLDPTKFRSVARHTKETFFIKSVLSKEFDTDFDNERNWFVHITRVCHQRCQWNAKYKIHSFLRRRRGRRRK